MGTISYLGAIILTPYTFAPSQYAFCNGQILQISDHQALLSLLGSIYGGDGYTTFGLPDLRGRLPVHQAPEQSPRFSLGTRSGTEAVTLTMNQMPSHSHPWQASTDAPDTSNPMATLAGKAPVYAEPESAETAPLHSGTVGSSGIGQAHSNMMPYLGLNFCIALHGLYPPRN